MNLNRFKAQTGRSHMLLTRRNGRREEMLRDESKALRKQYEDEKDTFRKKIEDLKQQINDLDEVRRENDDLYLKMSILLKKGVIMRKKLT